MLNEFLARDEKLVMGQIRRMERGNAIIEIGKLKLSSKRPNDPKRKLES